MNKTYLSHTVLSIVVFFALALFVSNAIAYDTYTGCASCHGNFTSGTYSSLAAAKAANPAWPGTLHDGHRYAMLNGNCNACHVASGRTPVYTYQSNGAAPFNLSCSGCHDGPGLRAHHVNSGADTSCYGCHSDPTPDPENVLRPVFAATFGTTSGTTRVNDPCNSASAGFEGRPADIATIGLDNDGNLLYDQNDPACAPATPVLSVSPPTLAFGSQNVGTTSSSQTVTLKNSGSAVLTINSISNSNSADFSISTPTTPVNIAAGATQTFTVAFKPTTTGDKSATVSITSNGGNGSVSATGTGVTAPAPVLSVSPTTLSFGSQNVGTTSSSQAVTLSNTGNAPLNVTSITSSSADFKFSPASVPAIAAGGSAALSVTFAPASVGAKSGTIGITGDGGSGSVRVTGTGSQTSATVPNVVGMTEAAAGTAITGAGLTAGTVTTQSSTTVAAGNVISQNPAAGASVAPGSAVDLVVSSGPSSATVPNVVGMTEAAAGTAITGAGLTAGTVTTQSSTTVAAGNVISQNPAAGASVAPGSAVDLVVSSGTPPAGGDDVALVNLTVPAQVTLRSGRSSEIEIQAYATTTAGVAKAAVTLTADPAAGVSVSFEDTVKTEELKASDDHPANFEFEARIVCKEIGTWPVNWTAQISSAQNSDSGNDALTGTTQVVCGDTSYRRRHRD